MFITHSKENGLVGELRQQLRQQAVTLHDNSLGNHDHTGDKPDQDDAPARPFRSALELQRVADSIPPVLGNATEGQHGYRHRDCLAKSKD